jgi:hypothetical protein
VQRKVSSPLLGCRTIATFKNLSVLGLHVECGAGGGALDERGSASDGLNNLPSYHYDDPTVKLWSQQEVEVFRIYPFCKEKLPDPWTLIASKQAGTIFTFQASRFQATKLIVKEHTSEQNFATNAMR